MKTVIMIITTAILTISCSAQPMKMASFKVKVVDEGGLPVSNATVSAGFYRNPKPGYGAGMIQNQVFVGTTDTNGLCTVSGQCHGSVGWNAIKDGYYRSYWPRLTYRESSLTRWEPWNQLFEITLRKIENPIAMYAKKLRGMPIPANGKELSYDLIQGDWLPPYGKGQTADILILVNYEFGGTLRYGRGRKLEASIRVSFPNKGDGYFRVLDLPGDGSVFHLPRYAPESGYTPILTLREYENDEENYVSQDERNNYFIRVRTKKDSEGNIVHALYGKIRGPIQFEFWPERAVFSMKYYLNPTPNDRNMEFDPKQNLFADLSLNERVNDP
jgi:hypothetical protein